MNNRKFFKRAKNALEFSLPVLKAQQSQPNIPDEMCRACPSCKKMIFVSDLEENDYVCNLCGHHFRINTRQRLHMLVDEDSFVEHDENLTSHNLINFPDYDRKLQHAHLNSKENEAVICGEAKIANYPIAIFLMEPGFMMGSMGTVVGEKITRLFEYATRQGLPVLGFAVSGGARMQEGMYSLMQMAKTSGAVKRHSDAGNLFISFLTDPTTGGVTASFAMEGDIILSEPKALVGFAGPRVIEQTIRQKLPPNFQRAELLLEKGFIDEIVPRKNQQAYLANLLALHVRGGAKE
ncbi:MAG: acetyl-CoA carboxylase, carboxyltransferase subunit beta [Bacillota bacterium]|jgi:acetyl-CoA carboxylase carboxyl transferase beta subunit